MGNRGGQIGNSNGARGKVWRDALDKAVKQYVDKDAGIERGEALFKIATGVVKQALIGNKDAIQELGNRLDGKPHQSMDIGLSTDTPLEELSDAELTAELARVRDALVGNTAKKSSKDKPTRVH
jgi:hypothetical protein